MIRETFIELIRKYSNNHEISQEFWLEIEEHYTEKHRAYHTLAHLQSLLNELSPVRSQIRDHDAVQFALFYHDIIYKASSSDNESQSAKLAVKRMKVINIPEHMIMKCAELIIATKKHEEHSDKDINLFTDADLSILGQPWNAYEEYIKQIRKEFSIFPDLLYKPGRKRSLTHFLDMPRIYKTEWFFNKYEYQARSNIRKEVSMLS
jgi:predicted metal-dependent HD superfamily phosphohydrolase